MFSNENEVLARLYEETRPEPELIASVAAVIRHFKITDSQVMGPDTGHTVEDLAESILGIIAPYLKKDR